MLFQIVARLIGKKPRAAFVFARLDKDKVTRFYMRPGVIVLDRNEMRLRNFTPHKVTVKAGFLVHQSIELAPQNDKGDQQKVKVDPEAKPGFHEYAVTVHVPNAPQDAIGDSQPGAIIDP